VGKVDLKFMNSALIMPGGSQAELLNTFYSRIFSSDFIRKVGETFITRIFLIGIGLATSVIVARILGPEGRGLYAVSISLGALAVQFGNLGIYASNTYAVVQRREALPGLISNSLWASLILGVLAFAIFYGVFVVWPNLIQIQGLLLFSVLISIPFGLAFLLLENLLIGLQDVHAYNIVEIGNRILCLILIGAMILFHTVRVETIYLCTMISIMGGSTWALARLKFRLSPFPAPTVSLFRENLRYGLKAYFASLLGFLVLRGDLFIIQYMLGSKQVGFYSIAVAVADLMCLLPVVIGTILFPRLSEMSSDRERCIYTRRVAWCVGVIMIIVSIFVALSAESIVKLLYGNAFLPSVPALLWLIPGIFMLSINAIFMNYFASIGMPLVTIYSPAMAALINMILNVKLIPILGIVGASISSTVAYGIMLILGLVYFKKKLLKAFA
jgi:O-antigen/teichoic acid export membrane protein